MRLNRFGVEFSYLLSVEEKDLRSRKCFEGSEKQHSINNLVCHYQNVFDFELLKIANEKRKIKWTTTYVHSDEEAIEVSSPIFSDLKECVEFYKAISSIAGKLQLPTHRSDCYSGGGHIHVEIDERNIFGKRLGLFDYFCFLSSLFQDLLRRPYLNWIFNEFCDTESAEPLQKYLKVHDGGHIAKMLHGGDRYMLFKENFDGRFKDYEEGAIRTITGRPDLYTEVRQIFGISKGYLARVSEGYKTIEYRFFDMPREKWQLKAHVEFAQAYTKWILSRSSHHSHFFYDKEVTGKRFIEGMIRKDRGLSQFSYLLENLGLDEAPYKEIIKMNYKKRKREGYLK